MLGAHVDVIELHHLVIGLPLLQVALAVKDLRAAEIPIIYLLINERKLAFEGRQIGFDQGMEILGVASNQILLLLVAQGALHMQVVDAAEQQHRDKEQEEAQPHAGDQRPSVLGLGGGHEQILFVSGGTSIYDAVRLV